MHTKEMQERTSAVILQMKEIRQKRGLTLQQICDMVEASGAYVSLSSIKRVFADGSENQGFRYQDTIQPIAKVLLEVVDEMPQGGDAEIEAEQLAALREVSLLKDSLMDELRAENAQLKDELIKVREECERKVEYLKKDHERKNELIQRKNKLIGALTALLCFLLCVIIAVLVYDKLNPDVGWFRDLAARFSEGYNFSTNSGVFL